VAGPRAADAGSTLRQTFECNGLEWNTRMQQQEPQLTRPPAWPPLDASAVSLPLPLWPTSDSPPPSSPLPPPLRAWLLSAGPSLSDSERPAAAAAAAVVAAAAALPRPCAARLLCTWGAAFTALGLLAGGSSASWACNSLSGSVGTSAAGAARCLRVCTMLRPQVVETYEPEARAQPSAAATTTTRRPSCFGGCADVI
jgi:hypothetical protein